MSSSSRSVEMIKAKGCSRIFLGAAAAATTTTTTTTGNMSSASPFGGVVVCVTGLSKEARRQVKDATERLGGEYSPNLNPKCTHLVVHSLGGRKFEHAFKHNRLFMVTLGWFVDSVYTNVRLDESLYRVKRIDENGVHVDELNQLIGFRGTQNSCIPAGIHESSKQSHMIEEARQHFHGDSKRSMDSTLSGHSIFVDFDVSAELRNKVVTALGREGAKVVDKWFVGCSVTHVVCEGSSVQRYLGHTNNIVTPLWVLKTTKEKNSQRLIHMSADLARQIGVLLENFQNGIGEEVINGANVLQDAFSSGSKSSHDERQQKVGLAKIGVRNRRGRRMQTCQTPIRPIAPSSLLDSICWTLSEPTSTVSIYMDSFSCDDVKQHHTSDFFDGKEFEASLSSSSRTLTESEKTELIFKSSFLTILFPLDRFTEMGPSSRTFFSDKGFTCLQVVDHIYAFYQENMSVDEIEAAIHTDSRHADRLRSVYGTADKCCFKRIDFLGSRKSFEMLKRVTGDNNSNVYELLIRA